MRRIACTQGMVGLLLGVSLTAGCEEDPARNGNSDGSSATDPATSSASETAGSQSDSDNTDSQGDASGSATSTTTSASDSNSDSASTTAVSTTAVSTTAATTTGDSSDDTSSVLDMGVRPDVGDNLPCEPPNRRNRQLESFLWAANSVEGTISKIDTQTVTEVGRYITRPDPAGSPSRTSVSLSGHVAVANRNGGVTKIYATEASCQDTNGMPGIQTSTDNNALPWDQEECRAWYIPLDYSSQRPVAWAPGEWNLNTCAWENEMLWTAGRNGSGNDADVILIDGDAGIVVDTVTIPGLKADIYGLYGGAVDAEGNFWATTWANGNNLVRVDIDDMSYQVWDGPSSTGLTSHWYGMTVDVNGYVWNCASRVARFDPMAETWTVSDELPSWHAGCMADDDPNGLLWLGGGISGATAIDRDTFQVVHQWPTPTSYGISIDFEGYVWTVNGNGAHRVDPQTGDVTSYSGLVGAYTYSDMTGYALSTVGPT